MFLTPYPDLADTVNMLQQEVQAILGRQFLGLYLGGSLALGDFNAHTSDVDFFVISHMPLGSETIRALAAMHARLAAGASRWGYELEGGYLPRTALGRQQLAARHPYVERGGALRLEAFGGGWVIQRHILHEHGVTLAGPPAQTLFTRVSANDLRRAVIDLLGWWEQQLEDPSLIVQDAYQAYAILTMCRILYTMQHGAIVSKPTAARWALQEVDVRWHGLIADALRWRPGESLALLPDTMAFIRDTVAAVG